MDATEMVYGLDGEFVGFTKEDYDQALEDKYGKAMHRMGSRAKNKQITQITPQNSTHNKRHQNAAHKNSGFSKEKIKAQKKNSWTSMQCMDQSRKEKSKIRPIPTDPSQASLQQQNAEIKSFGYLMDVDYKQKQGFDARYKKCKLEKNVKDEKQRNLASKEMGTKRRPRRTVQKKATSAIKKFVDDMFITQLKDAANVPPKCKANRKEDQECTDYELNDYMIQKKMRKRPSTMDIQNHNCQICNCGWETRDSGKAGTKHHQCAWMGQMHAILY